jgi:hypothetical protein
VGRGIRGEGLGGARAPGEADRSVGSASLIRSEVDLSAERRIRLGDPYGERPRRGRESPEGGPSNPPSNASLAMAGGEATNRAGRCSEVGPAGSVGSGQLSPN